MSCAYSQDITSDQISWDLSQKNNRTPMRYASEKWQVTYSQNQGVWSTNSLNFNRPLSENIIDFSRMILCLPFTIATTIQAAPGNTVYNNNAQFYSWKLGGVLNAVDRFILLLNGTTCGLQQSYLPVYSWLKYQFNTSVDWHRAFGGSLQAGSELVKDEINSYSSINYSAYAANSLGGNTGFCMSMNGTTSATGNLLNAPYAGTMGKIPDPGFQTLNQGSLGFNRGLWSRCVQMNGIGSLFPAADSSGNGFTPNVNNRASVMYAIENTTGSAANYLGCCTSGWLSLPLSMIINQFSALGLCANVQFTLQLFLNSFLNSQPSIAAADGVSYGRVGMASAGNLAQNYNPLIVTQAGCSPPWTGSGYSVSLPATGGNIKAIGLAFGCFGVSASGTAANPQVSGVSINTSSGTMSYNSLGSQNAELWYPEVYLSGKEMEEFLGSPKSVLSYWDFQNILQFQGSNGLGAGSLANFTLQGTLTSPRKIYVLAFPSSTLWLNNVNYYQQCLSNEPLISTPNVNLGNINCKVQSVPIYAQSLLYDYITFVNQVQEDVGFGAGLTPQLSGTLISREAWDRSKIWVFDTSRYCNSAQPVSVVLQFQNTNAFSLDFHIVVEQKMESEISRTATSWTLKQVPSEV